MCPKDWTCHPFKYVKTKFTQMWIKCWRSRWSNMDGHSSALWNFSFLSKFQVLVASIEPQNHKIHWINIALKKVVLGILRIKGIIYVHELDVTSLTATLCLCHNMSNKSTYHNYISIWQLYVKGYTAPTESSKSLSIWCHVYGL